jgi:hypothetical protein
MLRAAQMLLANSLLRHFKQSDDDGEYEEMQLQTSQLCSHAEMKFRLKGEFYNYSKIEMIENQRPLRFIRSRVKVLNLARALVK